MSENKVNVAEQARKDLVNQGNLGWWVMQYAVPLLDQLEQARREVEQLKADVRVAYGFDKDAVFANIDNLTALVARLRGALEPFGHAADRYDANDTCDEVDPTAPVLDYGVDTSVTVGHFRASRQALQGE